jgi:TldD protein
MQELTEHFLNYAHLNKISYADIRVIDQKRESLVIKNGQVEEINSKTEQGFGVRVLVEGCWGFAASFRLEKKEIERITKLALQIAKSSTLAKGPEVKLSPTKPIKAKYISKFEIDPFTLSLEKKLAYLLAAEEEIRKTKGIKISKASMRAFQTSKIFANTEGSYIEQKITECGAGIEATAIDRGDVQVRSYPCSHGGNFAALGFEFIKSLKLKENATRVAEEAVALLTAKECPSLETTVILEGSQLALQLHESIGHPAELDRVLGMEASFAGTSFLTRDKLNKFRIASPLVNIVADATIPGGLGSFGFDDEGIPAQRFDLVKDGLFVGYLTSRETAAQLGQTSNGCMRADGWNRIPLIRMTNINLLPGTKTLTEIIAETDEGLLLSTNKSWSIDDKRLNFQFATEIAWEIKKGKLGRIYKNANYTGLTPEFWSSCDAIAKDDWQVWGLPNCGKGEPIQVAHVGHGVSAARFRRVKVGVGK